MLEELKSAKFVVGLKQSLKMLEAGKVKKAYVADDVDFFVAGKIEAACEKNGVEIEKAMSKHELGKLCKIDVDAAIVSVLR